MISHRTLSALATLVPDCRHVIYAKDQPQYSPLPALIFPDGKVMTEWKPSEEERERLIAGESIRLWVWTFGGPLQPVSVEVTGGMQE